MKAEIKEGDLVKTLHQVLDGSTIKLGDLGLIIKVHPADRWRFPIQVMFVDGLLGSFTHDELEVISES